MPCEMLKIADIVVDEAFQGRTCIDEVAVSGYVLILREREPGDEWPFIEPCDVRRVDGVFYMVNGFHRRRAVVEHGGDKLLCDWVECTKNELIEAVCQANRGHGLPRNAADKRRVVHMALDTFPERSKNVIARLCDVSRGLVHSVVKERQRLSSEAVIATEQVDVAVTDDPDASPADDGFDEDVAVTDDPDDDEEELDDLDDDENYQFDSEVQSISDDVESERQHVNKVISEDGRKMPASADDLIKQRMNIADAIGQYPDLSNRKLAEMLDCDHKTVGRVRQEMGLSDVQEPSDAGVQMADAPPAYTNSLSRSVVVETEFDPITALEKLKMDLTEVRDSWPADFHEEFGEMLLFIVDQNFKVEAIP